MKSGFTLVEVMIAVTLMAIVFTALLLAFGSSRRATQLANEQTLALQAARNQMEFIMSSQYLDPAVSNGTHTATNALSRAPNYYTYTVTSNQNFQNTKDIALTVRWLNPSGQRTNSISLNSSISDALH